MGFNAVRLLSLEAVPDAVELLPEHETLAAVLLIEQAALRDAAPGLEVFLWSLVEWEPHAAAVRQPVARRDGAELKREARSAAVFLSAAGLLAVQFSDELRTAELVRVV